jgi:hypothetical protein
VRRPALTALGAAAATALAAGRLTAGPPGGAQRWTRTNHRGEPLTLLEGPAAVVGLAVTLAAAPGVPGRLRAAATVAAVGAGAFGLADDLGETGSSKGLRGHLSALRRGELTTGGLKVLGIGVTGLVAGALALPGGRAGIRGAAGRGLDVATAGALVAGTANLFNLLDLRPGRALKVSLVATPAVLAPHPAAGLAAAVVGTGAALLPADLAERSMLGDCGANAVGAVLGTAMVAATPRPVRLVLLAAVTGLTLASEKVSFTKVIEATPVLRELDAIGRRPR